MWASGVPSGTALGSALTQLAPECLQTGPERQPSAWCVGHACAQTALAIDTGCLSLSGSGCRGPSNGGNAGVSLLSSQYAAEKCSTGNVRENCEQHRRCNIPGQQYGAANLVDDFDLTTQPDGSGLGTRKVMGLLRCRNSEKVRTYSNACSVLLLSLSDLFAHAAAKSRLPERSTKLHTERYPSHI